MVTGESIVLYSRLHLITQNRLILRIVLSVILFNAVALYVPTSCLNYGAILNPTTEAYVRGYQTMERVQMYVKDAIVPHVHWLTIGTGQSSPSKNLHFP